MNFRSKICPPQGVSVPLFIDTCSATFVVPLLLCVCLYNNSKCRLPSFFSPSSCTVLNFLVLLAYITACTSYNVNRWAYFQEKSNLWNNFIQKMRGGLFLRVGLFLRDLRYCITVDIQDCLSQSGLVIYLRFRKSKRSLPKNHLWHNWKLNYLNSSQTLLPMSSYCTS